MDRREKNKFFFAAFKSLKLMAHFIADCIYFFMRFFSSSFWHQIQSKVSLSLLRLCAAAVVAATLPAVVFVPSVHTRLRCLLCCCFSSLGEFFVTLLRLHGVQRPEDSNLILQCYAPCPLTTRPTSAVNLTFGPTFLSTGEVTIRF